MDEHELLLLSWGATFGVPLGFLLGYLASRPVIVNLPRPLPPVAELPNYEPPTAEPVDEFYEGDWWKRGDEPPF